MINAKTLNAKQRDAAKAEARNAASDEIKKVVAAAKDHLEASRRHKAFIKNLEAQCPGDDILTLLSDGGASDKKWSQLLKERGRAADREHAAVQQMIRVFDRVLAAHGLQTVLDIDDACLEKQARMTKKEWDDQLPDGIRIKNELVDELHMEIEEAHEGEQLEAGKWESNVKRKRTQRKHKNRFS